jgi:regulator of protease activity HflC (stomatin/prohibitin superfamily)
VVVAVLIILSGLKVLKEYERGVVFRLGRLTPYRERISLGKIVLLGPICLYT